MKTIKDLKEAINNLPDNMPITIYNDGATFRNNIYFHIKKLWGTNGQQEFFIIDKTI